MITTAASEIMANKIKNQTILWQLLHKTLLQLDIAIPKKVWQGAIVPIGFYKKGPDQVKVNFLSLGPFFFKSWSKFVYNCIPMEFKNVI